MSTVNRKCSRRGCKSSYIETISVTQLTSFTTKFSCLFAEKFKLAVNEGEFTDSEILVLLGENGESCLDLKVLIVAVRHLLC